MKFQERSFVDDHSMRPRPEIRWNESDGVVIILTTWGSTQENKHIISIIEDYILSSRMDEELTSPFQTLSQYSNSKNTLRTAMLLANNHIYKNQNRDEYLAGYEIFAGFKSQNQFLFTSIGHPHVILSRSKKSLLPIHMNLDHAMDLSQNGLLPPLPNQLLGISAQPEIIIRSLQIQKGDKILLTSKSWLTNNLLKTPAKELSFEIAIKELAKPEDQPFWCGLIEL